MNILKFTNFAPNISAVNSSNACVGMDTEFDASAIFNLSAIMQSELSLNIELKFDFRR